eukprot:TRINITY_DN356_c3_g1_i2.p1 TRINITY_DN356_c3_g1~~TRINITY_DN356_c3_g1_i2.p1  ORF type:complete len:1503 (-),score=415.33 TRINITY_DN356_c3_g1_i2:457-4965(-)
MKRSLVSSIILLLVFSIYITQAAPKTTSSSSSTCSTSRIRKSWSSMKETEQNLFIDAIQTLKSNGKWNEIVDMYMGSSKFSHGTGAFLPWHRVFLWEVENMIRNLGDKYKCVTIPYWNWESDAGRERVSSILSPKFFGNKTDPDTHCLRDGLFKGWVTSDNNCLMRTYDSEYGFVGEAEIAHIITGYRIYGKTAIGFRSKLEAAPHAAVLNYLGNDGGQLGSFRSPDDPLFYLILTNVDRIFSIWQDCHDLDKVDFETADADTIGASYQGTKKGLDDDVNLIMPFMWKGKPFPSFSTNYRIRDGLSINNHRINYRYAAPDHMVQLLDKTYGDCKWDWFVLPVTKSKVSVASVVTEFSNTEQLDSKCTLKYNIEGGNTIRMRMECNTEDSWIAIGWGAESNGMDKADCAIATKTAKGYIIADYFADGFSKPAMDKSQNIAFVNAGSEDGMTFMEFTRPLSSGDADQDKDIVLDANTKLVWAYGNDGSSPSIDYHGATQRGTKQFSFSSSSKKRSISQDSMGHMWDNSVSLGGGVAYLFWKVNYDTNTIRMRAEFTVDPDSWIAIGWSPDGHPMKNADVAILQRKSGRLVVGDYISTDFTVPTRDDHQDLVEQVAGQDRGVTFMEFTRALDTHDPQDKPILPGMTTIIWGFGNSLDQLGIHSNKGHEDVAFIQGSGDDHVLPAHSHSHSHEHDSESINDEDSEERETIDDERWQNESDGSQQTQSESSGVEVVWDGKRVLEKGVTLSWKEDGDYIHMRFEVQNAPGWIGIGWGASDGGMNGADMVILSRLEDGYPLIGDYFSRTYAAPVLDTVQNVIPIRSGKTESVTFMEFKKPIDNVGDSSQDRSILRGSVSLIWAAGPRLSTIDKHIDQGSASVVLLGTRNSFGEVWDGYNIIPTERNPIGKISWKFRNEDEIVIRLEIETDGWIGLGWSPDGHSMTNADCVILTKDPITEEYVLGDYFSYGLVAPTLDKSQDVVPLQIGYEEGITFMEFSRKLDTGDNMDKPLAIGNARFIWAYGSDPYNLDYHQGRYHARFTLTGPLLQQSTPFTGEWDGELSVLRGSGSFYWKIEEDDSVRMRLEVSDADGWISVGWNPDDHAMQNADCVIMMQKEGKFHIGDYFSKSYVIPVLDEHQDVIPVVGGVDNGMVFMEFIRKFETEDKDDKPILQGKMRMIFAYGGDMDILSYHDSRDKQDVTLVKGGWSGVWENEMEFENIAKLWWTVDLEREVARFKFEVATEGWIAIGWGPSDNGMKNGDCVILTREDGIYTIGDYYTTDYAKPKLDKIQNIVGFDMGYKDGKTFMEFERPLDSGDSRQDRPIDKGPMRFIWAYGKTLDHLSYHAERGNPLIVFYGAPVHWDGMQEFDRHRARLWWKVEGSMIRMRFEAKTPGYVAIGIEPEDFQGMLNTDMLIMTRVDGEYTIQDYFSVGYSTPVLDTTQDVLQITAGHRDGWSFMEFVRPLDTKDKSDKVITKGPTRIVWAYGRDLEKLQKHSRAGNADITFIPGK